MAKGNYNKQQLMGRVTKDPELRQTIQGVSVATVNVAVNRPKTKNGEEKSDFFKIEVWDKKADFVAQYVGKGDLVFVEGPTNNDEYVDKDTGQKRYISKVKAYEFSLIESKNKPDVQGNNTNKPYSNDSKSENTDDPFDDDSDPFDDD